MERQRRKGEGQRRRERQLGRGKTEMSRDTKRERGKIQKNTSQMERWVWGEGQAG